MTVNDMEDSILTCQTKLCVIL